MSAGDRLVVDIAFVGKEGIESIAPARWLAPVTAVLADLIDYVNSLKQLAAFEAGFECVLKLNEVEKTVRRGDLDTPISIFADTSRKVQVDIRPLQSTQFLVGGRVLGMQEVTEMIEIAVSEIVPKQPGMPMPSSRAGQMVKEALERANRLTIMKKAKTGLPFLPKDLVSELAIAKDETAMVKLITPHLNAALFGNAKHDPALESNPWTLTNTELIQRLHHYKQGCLPRQELLPDLLLTKSAVIHFRGASSDDQGPGKGYDCRSLDEKGSGKGYDCRSLDEKGTDKGYNYGGLVSSRLQRHRAVTKLLDAAACDDITEEHYGVARNYCSHCAPGVTKAMIIAKRTFLLIEFSDSFPIHAIECPNTLAGGAQLIRDFFFARKALRPDGCDVLSAIDFHLARLHATLHFVDGSCYLGSGATAHVFRVMVDGRIYAMKVLLSSDVTPLLVEYRALQALAEKGAPVISVVSRSFNQQVVGEDTISAAYLMTAGDSICPPHKIAEAIKALQDVHNAGYIHGDARRDNLMVIDAAVSAAPLSAATEHVSKLVWIDVMPTVIAPYTRKVDIQMLLCSFTGLPPDHELILSQVELYDPSDPLISNKIAAQLTTNKAEPPLNVSVGQKRGRDVFEGGKA